MDESRDGLSPLEAVGLVIRQLQASDVPRLIKLDEMITGRRRTEWFERKLTRDTDIQISLGAEKDGLLVGALMGAVHFGAFGVLEPVAVLDTVVVDPEFARGGVATEMFQRFMQAMQALQIARVRTEVDWDDIDLIAFFGKTGFRPVARVVLERSVASEER